MTTNVDLSEDEFEELKALTNETTAAAAVRSAIREYLQSASRARLTALSGQVTMDDNWRDLEEMELRS